MVVEALCSLKMEWTYRIAWWCGGGKDWRFGIIGCKLVYTEWIDKVLPYTIGNYIQCPGRHHNGDEYIYV